VRDGFVFEAEGGDERPLLEVSGVPATMGGTATFQVSNVLAVVAACRAQGVAAERIAAALYAFRSAEHNPGRTNLFRVASGGYVMLDYGHNPDAFGAVCRMAARWEGRRVTGIVGVPGDRDDALIEEAARVAARGFRRVVVREDSDLRGREPGEVARILCRTIAREAPGRECSLVLDEVEALAGELRGLKDGEVVVVFYDRLEPLLRLLEGYGAAPVSLIEGLGAGAQAMAASASSSPSSAAPPREEGSARERGGRRAGSRAEGTGAGGLQHYVSR
jgi:cyanophycin synthetase